MKTVVVSQRVDVVAERGERRDALDQQLSSWLLSAGYLPVPLPNIFGDIDADPAVRERWLATVRPAAVLLTGGNDIGSCAERDSNERSLMQWAAQHGAPLLGICRGMQMMGVASGVNLTPVAGHARTRHAVHGQINRRAVNSYHDYALSECPSEYDVLAESEDGVIEAIRHCERQWEGWMWHPERGPAQAEDVRRLQAVFGV